MFTLFRNTPIGGKYEKFKKFRLSCRTPNLALNLMWLDRFVNQTKVDTGVFHLLSIEVLAKRD